MSKKIILVAGTVALLIGAAIFWRVREASRPNVLIITLDTTRADYLGCYGSPTARTPALDGFAQSGVRFTRAFCNVPLTLASHATIMTGLYPPEHGSRVNGIEAISKDAPTLAEVLAARGYRTGAFVAAVVLDARFGLDRGFATYDDYEVPGGFDPQDEMALIRYRRGDEVADSALAWLREKSRKPFFCWVHFYDPHRPFILDEPIDPPDIKRAYGISISFMDKQVARILAHLQKAGLSDRTLVVVMADHGEALGQHGEDEHGLLLYNEVMHIPLMVRLPRGGSGLVSDATVSTVDIVPTLFDLLQVKAPAPVSGRSFARALHGERLPEAPVYFETKFPLTEYGWSPLYGVLRGDWKYIRAPREELYDLARDPGETNNMAAVQALETKNLRNVLVDMEGRMTARAAAEVKLDGAARRALESLGYAGGGGSTQAKEKDGLRDPKEAIWMRREFMDALEDVREGRKTRAEERLTKLVAESPESLAFHYKLGQLLYGQGRFEEACQAFEIMAKRFSDDYAPHYNLGKTLIKLKRYDEAIAELDLAAKLDDQKVEVINNLGLAYLHKGDMPEAMKTFQRSIAIDSKQVDPHSNLGHVLLQMGKTDEAMSEFRRALEIEPNAFGPRYNLGLALLQAARFGEAARELEQAVRLRPDFAPAREKLKLATDRASLMGLAP